VLLSFQISSPLTHLFTQKHSAAIHRDRDGYDPMEIRSRCYAAEVPMRSSRSSSVRWVARTVWCASDQKTTQGNQTYLEQAIHATIPQIAVVA